MSSPQLGLSYSKPPEHCYDWFIPEILQIIRRFSSQSDFANFCSASRALYVVGILALYSSIALEDCGWADDERLEALVETLDNNAELSSHVRSLDFAFESPWYPPDEATHLLSIATIIRKCPNIRSIQIDDEWNPDLDMDEFLDSLSSLTRLEKLR